MFRLEISAVSQRHADCVFDFFFFFSSFDLYTTVLEMRLASSVFHQHGAEGLIWKQKNRCMYLCRPVWHPHWCYVHVAGRQGHTQTHTGTEAAGERCLRCLLLPPDGLHHRATGLFLPCFLCPPPPPMSWASGEACGLTLRQLPGCLPHTWPPGNYEKIPPTPSSGSKGRSQHIIFVGSGRWLSLIVKSVINHHRNMLKLVHTPKLN